MKFALPRPSSRGVRCGVRLQLPRHEDADDPRRGHGPHRRRRAPRRHAASARPRPCTGRRGEFWNLELGFKYRMSAMQAAMGVVQLDRVDELVGMKRQLFELVLRPTRSRRRFGTQPDADGVDTYWMTTIVLDERFGLTKSDVIRALGARGVTARPFFHPSPPATRSSTVPRAPRPGTRSRTAWGASA